MFVLLAIVCAVLGLVVIGLGGFVPVFELRRWTGRDDRE